MQCRYTLQNQLWCKRYSIWSIFLLSIIFSRFWKLFSFSLLSSKWAETVDFCFMSIDLFDCAFYIRNIQCVWQSIKSCWIYQMDSITDNFVFVRVKWIEGTYLWNFIYYEKTRKEQNCFLFHISLWKNPLQFNKNQ